MTHKTSWTRKHMSLSQALWIWGVIAAVLMGCGYVLYLWLFLTEGIQPNATSWTLWGAGGFIEAWSFWKVIQASRTDQDSKEHHESPLSLAPLVCATSAFIIAGVGLWLGKFLPPEPWEYLIAALDIAVVLSYFYVKATTGEARKAARVANALMMLDIFLSFVPIWGSTWMAPERESALPWLIWTFSYLVLGLLGATQIQKKWNVRRWLVIYPFTSAVVHGIVAWIVLTSGSA